MEVYIINDTTSSIEINDLNSLMIDPEETLDIMNQFSYSYISASIDLTNYVLAGHIIVNNGIKNLSPEDGAEHLDIETVYEAKHEILEHTDMPDLLDGIEKQVLVSDSTSFNWVEYIEGGGSGSGSHNCSFIIGQHEADFVQLDKTDYIIVRSFIFEGTDSWTPSNFGIIASKEKDDAGKFGNARLYDPVNNNEICTLEWEAKDKAFYTTSSLQNLPANKSIIEFQMRASARMKIRIHYIALY